MRISDLFHPICLVCVLALVAGFAHSESLSLTDTSQTKAMSRGVPGPPDNADSNDNKRLRDRFKRIDEQLNSEYASLRSKLQGGELRGMIAAQRAWLKTRDQSCGLDRAPQSRDAWIAYVVESENRTQCVMDATEKRLEDIRRLERQVSGVFVAGEVSPPFEKPAVSVEEMQAANDSPSAMRLRSSRAHRTGRYYFEIVIDDARAGDTVANVAAQVGTGVRFYSMDHEIKSRDLVLKLGETDSVRIVGGDLGDLRIPKVVLGWAVDLDAGRLYRYQDGTWMDDAPPGSNLGIAIDRDSDIFAEVVATVVATEPIATLVGKGILKVNFGEEPFTGNPPAGYRGFDWPDHLVSEPPAVEAPTGMSGKDRIAGLSQVQWLQRYAEWIRSFPESESPMRDATGERCGAGQSGAMWFLAGARGAVGKVRRECIVPMGKSILIPVIDTVAQAPPTAPCDQMQVAVKKFTEDASGIRFSLDGAPWRESEIRQLGTSCFKLRDGATGQMTTAVTSGYWVFLPPLRTGRHVIEFAGRFKAEGFDQDVTYILNVR